MERRPVRRKSGDGLANGLAIGLACVALVRRSGASITRVSECAGL